MYAGILFNRLTLLISYFCGNILRAAKTMKTIIEKFDEENWESVYEMCVAMYLQPNCYAFAIALSRGTGWPMHGILAHDTIWHAGVRDENGRFRDARGIVPEAEIGQALDIDPPYVTRVVAEEDLFRIKPIPDRLVVRASIMAEALWPELPWKKEAFRSRAIAFTEELAELCRKHKVWIRPPTDHLMYIEEPYGDEGFRIQPTMLGQYAVNRYIGEIGIL
jgi:hypothetical protein